MGCKMCEKTKMNCRKGLWSPNEDQKLKDYILKHGHGCWSSVPLKAGLQRNGKSCRLRWINYLRPGLKRGAFTAEEEATIVKLHTMWGNKWSRIAMHLPGRTDNELKNHWHTYLKKKLPKADECSPSVHQPSNASSLHSDTGTSKPEQPPEENNSQISFSESSISQESIYSASPQSITNNSNDQPPLPKILFADWLPMLSYSDQSSWALNDNGTAYRPELSFIFEVPSPELEMECANTGVHGMEDSSIYGELQLQFEPVEPIPYDLSSFSEANTGFELNHDYIFSL